MKLHNGNPSSWNGAAWNESLCFLMVKNNWNGQVAELSWKPFYANGASVGEIKKNVFLKSRSRWSHKLEAFTLLWRP